MDDEIMINGVKYRRVVEEPIQEGDWVEAINDGCPGFVHPGAKGIVMRPSTHGFWVEWKSGEFDHHSDAVWNIKDANLRKIDPPAPAPAPLKYKPGDIVLVPVRVVEVDETDAEETYLLRPMSCAQAQWYNRGALEPPEPQVGQRVIAWDAGPVGKLALSDAGHRKFKYHVESDDGDYTIPWFTNAVAIE